MATRFLAPLAALATLALGGCGADKTCRPDTAFLTFTLPDGISLPATIDITVTIGQSAKTSSATVTHLDSSAEIHFPNGYPEGQIISFTVDVAGASLLQGSATAPKGCLALELKPVGVSDAGGDAGAADQTATDVDGSTDAASVDLADDGAGSDDAASIDMLPGADLTPLPAQPPRVILTAAQTLPASTAWVQDIVDFDGDGRLDVAGFYASGIEIVMNGPSLFESKLDFADTGGSFAFGYIDADGIIDMISVDTTARELRVRLGGAGNTLGNPDTTATGVDPTGARLAKLDSDKNVDAVVANTGSDNVSVFINTGSGGFSPKVDYSTGASSHPTLLAVADLDKDGYDDVIVNINDGTNKVAVLINNKDGTLKDHQDYGVVGVRSLAVGDLNGDGFPDIIAADGSVSVLINKKDGTFETKVDYPIPNSIVADKIAIADVDNKQHADIIVAGASTGIALLTNQGNGTFDSGTRILDSFRGANIGLVVADVTNDGSPDIVFSSDKRFGVLWNRGDGTFRASLPLAAGILPYGLAVGNITDDTHPDIVVACYGPPKIATIPNNNNRTFAAKVFTTANTKGTGAIARDLSGDGKIDVATSSEGGGASVFLNDKAGGLLAKTDYAAGTKAVAIAAGNLFSSGGLPDLVVANAGTNNVSTFKNNNDGTFATKVDFTTGTTPSSVQVGDVSADGANDVVVANNVSGTVSVLINDKAGSLQGKVDYDVQTNPTSLVLADVSGDGKLDIIVTNGGVGTVSVLKNQGAGTFASQTTFNVGTQPRSVAAGDLDGDTKIDLVIANHDDKNVTVLVNDGTGAFNIAIWYALAYSPQSVALADLDGDGRLDVVVTYDATTSPTFENTVISGAVLWNETPMP